MGKEVSEVWERMKWIVVGRMKVVVKQKVDVEDEVKTTTEDIN